MCPHAPALCLRVRVSVLAAMGHKPIMDFYFV